MEPSTPTPKNTVIISIVSVVIVAVLIAGGVYMYKHQASGAPYSDTSGQASTTPNNYNLGEDDTRTVTADERAAVAAYMGAHITTLSPKKAKAGHTFTITTITIEAANRAIVEYTDGITSYTAAVSYGYDSAGVVTVASFDILEK